MELVELARNSIKSKLNGKKLEVSEEIKKKYNKQGASFVTLTKGGDLRGCIGSLGAHKPLWQDVKDNAVHAAFNDPRFMPLDKYDFKDTKIEVSVLSEPKKLGKGKEILSKLNKDMGLILRKGYFTSTFLPQVWEEIPDAIDFLEHLSAKAGLSKDDWKSAEFFYYTVEKYKE